MKTIKKTTLMALLILSFTSYSQDEIEGFWLTQERNSIIEIYKHTDDKYYGKVVWLEEPTDKNGNKHTDKKNRNKSLRGRPIMGMNMLENLEYQDYTWEGTIYAAKNGRTLDTSLTMKNPDELQVKISFMGMQRVQSWLRTESPQ